MAIAPNRLLTPMPKWLAWYLNYGLADKLSRARRKQFSANLIALVAALAWALNSVGYVLFDLSLWPASAVALLASLIGLTVPLIFARHEALAVVLLIGALCVVYPVMTLLLGSRAGIFLYMFVLPSVALVVLGPSRIAIVSVIGLSCAVVIAFCTWLDTDPALPAANDPGFLGVQMLLSIAGTMVFVVLPVFVGFQRAERAEEALEAEHARSEALLYNLLPTEIAARLKQSPEQTIADSLDHTAILFADIVDFTPRSARMTPEDLVSFLNRVFSTFDALAMKHGLEKIKTIGDAYMVAAGLPQPVDKPLHRVAEMAFDMLDALRTLSEDLGEEIEIRIGLDAGPVVAGVIGHQKLFYDAWGDTVNTASRLESHGVPGRIQVTEAARDALKDTYDFEPRGPVEIKGIGTLKTWWLKRRS